MEHNLRCVRAQPRYTVFCVGVPVSTGRAMMSETDRAFVPFMDKRYGWVGRYT